jgi:hypothetical protein
MTGTFEPSCGDGRRGRVGVLLYITFLKWTKQGTRVVVSGAMIYVGCVTTDTPYKDQAHRQLARVVEEEYAGVDNHDLHLVFV